MKDVQEEEEEKNEKGGREKEERPREEKKGERGIWTYLWREEREERLNKKKGEI